MPRKPVLENPEYTELFFKVLSGKAKPKELKDYNDPVINIRERHESERESKRLSSKLKHLRKFGFLQRQEEGWEYSVNYEGILLYLYRRVLNELTHKKNLISGICEHPAVITFLKEYLKLISASHVDRTDLTLNTILKDFVLGINPGRIIRERSLKDKPPEVRHFLKDCQLFPIEAKDVCILTAFNVCREELAYL